MALRELKDLRRCFRDAIRKCLSSQPLKLLNNEGDFVGHQLSSAAKEKVIEGVTHYFVEDFLWPDGKHRAPRKGLYFGTDYRRYRFGAVDQTTPTYSLVPSGCIGDSPVSLRTEDDLERYIHTGEVVSTESHHSSDVDFDPPDIADGQCLKLDYNYALRRQQDWEQWHDQRLIQSMRADGREPVLQQPCLFYMGRRPSREVQFFEAEIHFVFGIKQSDLNAPPRKDLKYARRRQAAWLKSEWKKSASTKKIKKWMEDDERLDAWTNGRIDSYEAELKAPRPVSEQVRWRRRPGSVKLQPVATD